ncbi:histone deacetylase [Brachybacterium endophyticum]|uniref:Histone deacetylase n=1 Tax=Brachybacterium endophyticum TaxID=2182385 RepID=A0A2U2RNC9_9MICO|nr:histone deacetylase [Brachybacterium endophyticum]PWH07368.1 histone deacetylase [Brachybacterium endophyticum]
MDPASELVWYVSYGSNMNAERLACYIEGGRPPGALIGYTGARDPAPPRDSAGVMLPGRLHFALRSRVWDGGIGFYDHEAEGPTPARAFLVTIEQFADVAAQEMHRPVQADDPVEALVREDLGPSAPTGARVAVGPGHYETLLRVGERDGLPMLTFTSPVGATGMTATQPTPAYLDMLAEGLRQAHGWDRERANAYFADRGADLETLVA